MASGVSCVAGGRAEGFASSDRFGIRKQSGLPAPAPAGPLSLITSFGRKKEASEPTTTDCGHYY